MQIISGGKSYHVLIVGAKELEFHFDSYKNSYKSDHLPGDDLNDMLQLCVSLNNSLTLILIKSL